MHIKYLPHIILSALLIVAITNVYASNDSPALTDKPLIDSARSAAPAKVGENATVVAMESDGSIRTIIAGTNGFACMPDNPATPGPDPMCMDKNAIEWAMAWVGHKTPPTGKVGFIYMLLGGTDASNTDPYASEPAPDNHWINTGPHVMVVGADKSFYDLYPKGADPEINQLYTMWGDTPYVHLMAPVK